MSAVGRPGQPSPQYTLRIRSGKRLYKSGVFTPIVARARSRSKRASFVRNNLFVHSFANKKGVPFRIPSSNRCG